MVPVISISFGNCKGADYKQAVKGIADSFYNMYEAHRYLLKSTRLEAEDLKEYKSLRELFRAGDTGRIEIAIQRLCRLVYLHYQILPVILVDEYDTPLLEAYTDGYWSEMIGTCRQLFHSTFKENPYYARTLLTGVTKVSKNSLFSDLNNLETDTVTCDAYSDCFGFTEQEVMDALKCQNMDTMHDVKEMYDGFIFGQRRDIYNPWSITNYLKEKKLKPYWAATSSNALISKLIQTASADMKKQMERLLNGELITVSFDEQVVFSQLEQDESAIWSLLVASGYLKVEDVEYRGMTLEPWYHLDITNLETVSMFSNMFKGWFAPVASNYNEFIRALLEGNVKAMNLYMNDVALATFSSFDVGKYVSERTQPERFYHGFVLGLLIEIRDRYDVRSNRESGFGRYDVMLLPKSKRDNAIILEFKVREPDSEKTLEDTVESALDQIIEKKYDAELLGLGITQERIRHYGFAFEGKKVLIG